MSRITQILTHKQILISIKFTRLIIFLYIATNILIKIFLKHVKILDNQVINIIKFQSIQQERSKMFLLTKTGLKVFPKSIPQYSFSRLKQKQKQREFQKIETVSFKKNIINDYTKIACQTEQKLNFINGKCLIYQNIRKWRTVLWQSSHFWGTIAGLSWIIYINPLADVFPASVPILVFINFVVLKLWLNRMKKYRNIVSEIYLFENGQATEIYFANRFKRRLFGQEQKKIYYNSLFANPDFEKQQVILLNKQNVIFPHSLQQAQKQSQGYIWIKYYSNGQNLLVIPKKPNFMYLKLLIEIFNGKIVIFNKS